MKSAGRQSYWFKARACILLLFLCAQAGQAAGVNRVTHYNLRIWQTDDGLPQNSVYAIAQTADGYLWVGSHEGLARFDGIKFTIFDFPRAPELRRGWITALCAARDGSLWIGCE